MTVMSETQASLVEPGWVTLETPQGASRVKCDRIIARMGSAPPRKFVEDAGYQTDAEKDADSMQTTLDSRQPPDDRSIALKNQADQAVQSAVTGLTDLRIAVRRNDIPGIRKAEAELAKVLPQLKRFAS